MTTITASKSMRVPHFIGGGKVDWIEKPIPEPGPGQLLIQVKANALCGSERGQFFDGSEATPGHEAAGIVVKAGPGTKTAVGARGAIYLMDFCGECRSCKLGLTNMCLAKRADMGFNQDGGYGQYELINENIFFEVADPDITFAEMTMLLDVMGTSAHAIHRAQMVHPDIQSLLVTGAGPVGIGVLVQAKMTFGMDFPVFVTDISPWRLGLVERLGGKPVNVQEADLSQSLQKYGQPKVDLAIDGSGRGAARQSALEVLDKRGVLITVGHGQDLHLDVSSDLIANERAVLGSEYFIFSEFDNNLKLLQANRDYLSSIITHRFGVEEIQGAFEIFYKGETGKVVIEQ